jgi:hypothetical protein
MTYLHHLLSAAGGVGAVSGLPSYAALSLIPSPSPTAQLPLVQKGSPGYLTTPKKHPSHRGDGRAPGFDEGFIGMPIVPVMGGGPL